MIRCGIGYDVHRLAEGRKLILGGIEILKQVSKLLAEKKARVLNIDATVIAEEPKIAPHVFAMRQKIAFAIDSSESDVSIKATTNEKLGFIGRGEGIAAMAVATVEQK